MKRIAVATLLLLAAACATKKRPNDTAIIPQEPKASPGEVHPQAGSDPLDESSQPTTDEGGRPPKGEDPDEDEDDPEEDPDES